MELQLQRVSSTDIKSRVILYPSSTSTPVNLQRRRDKHRESKASKLDVVERRKLIYAGEEVYHNKGKQRDHRVSEVELEASGLHDHRARIHRSTQAHSSEHSFT